MPINFNYNTHYNIDYSKLFNSLIKLPIFKNYSLNLEFLSTWINILKKYDNTKTHSLLNNNEFYQYCFDFCGIDLIIHFNITNTLKVINNFDIYTLSLHLFNNNLNTFDYSYVDKSFRKFITFNNPIVIINFILGESMKYLVIDGNKRLSHYLDINKKHIDCIFIDFNNINESLFVSKFDFILYLFIHDIHNIHHLIHNNIIDEHDYSKFSFINNI